jgi:PAS domain S-box-containing protein
MSQDKRPETLDETAAVSFVMDGNGEIVEWHPAAEALFGWTRDEAIGRRLSELMIPAHQREAHEQGLKRFLSMGTQKLLYRPLRLTVVHRDGHQFEADFQIGAEQDATGHRFPAKTSAVRD